MIWLPSRWLGLAVRAGGVADRLVDELEGGRERLQIGIVYIGEPSQHLTLAINGVGELVNDPSRHYGNRTIDLLFHSVAAHAGPRAIGVILSGTLDDGSRGLVAMHEAGGITMVLTPSSLPEHGMPSNAIAFDGPGYDSLLA